MRCIIGIVRKNEQMFYFLEHPHPLKKKGRNEMRRTYVFNVIFKIMAALGIFCIIGSAGMSDLGNVSNTQLFIQCGISLFFSAVGIWGSSNCSRALAAMERRRLREKARQQNNVVAFRKAA